MMSSFLDHLGSDQNFRENENFEWLKRNYTHNGSQEPKFMGSSLCARKVYPIELRNLDEVIEPVN